MFAIIEDDPLCVQGKQCGRRSDRERPGMNVNEAGLGEMRDCGILEEGRASGHGLGPSAGRARRATRSCFTEDV